MQFVFRIEMKIPAQGIHKAHRMLRHNVIVVPARIADDHIPPKIRMMDIGVDALDVKLHELDIFEVF